MGVLSFCFPNFETQVNIHLTAYRGTMKTKDGNALGAQWLPKTVVTVIAVVLTIIQGQLTSTGAQEMAV